MEFEQISLFDTLQLPFHYQTLDNDGKIYFKIDWLTVMFFDVSLNDVLHTFQLDDAVSDFLLGYYEQCRGYDNVFNFVFNGVKLETKSDNFYGLDLGLGLFDVQCPKIRLELSGSALDYLRSRGLDIENFVRVPFVLPDPGQYHFTRCDFAYDFINYQPHFLDQMIDYIYKNQLPSGRIPIHKKSGGLSCKVVSCGQKTVYLGSPQSDKMLRVYDKRLEQMDLRSMTYKKENPYNDPESWIRIEWQVRNMVAHKYLLGSDHDGKYHDAKTILKDIFSNYAFAEGIEGDKHRNHVKPVDFWLQLFNWQDVESRIIQNQKYVQFVKPDDEAVNRFRTVCMRSFIIYYSLVGANGLQEDVDAYLKSLYKGTPESNRRYLAFLNRLNILEDFSLPQQVSPGRGLYNNCGRFAFKL